LARRFDRAACEPIESTRFSATDAAAATTTKPIKTYHSAMTLRTLAVSLALLAVAQAAVAQNAPAPAAAAPAAPTPTAPAAAAPAAPAGDPAKGWASTRMCEGCHGIPGWRTAYPEVYNVPKLGGQHEAYLAKALQEYKNGDRTHPSMRAIAASLSDEDILNLAAYYSRGLARTASK